MKKKSGLQSITEDTEAEKNELEVIKKGVTRLMINMDVIRNELEKIRIE